MKVGLLVFALVFSVGASASDEVYKWTDANGVTHYADAPPQGNKGKVDRVMLRGGVTSSAPAEPAPKVDTSAKDDASGTAQDSPEARARICREARANMELLQSNYKVSMPTGNDGKPQTLSDEQRAKELEKTSNQVSFYCK